MALPDNLQLLKHEEQGMTHQEIADLYRVTRQAVTYRFNAMGEYKRGNLSGVSESLPWDFSAYPPELKRKIWSQDTFLGLRTYVRLQLGETVSRRAQLSLRAFLNRVRSGDVLAVDMERGAHYVPRDVVRDGSLVVRWPEGVPRDHRVSLLQLPPEAEADAPVQEAASGC